MLQTRPSPAASGLTLASGLVLPACRASEATGPARGLFALLVAARLAGTVLWLQPSWAAERLMGDAVRGLIDPGRLVFGAARTPKELLWAAEETLRTGLVPLVVVDLAVPPGLTAVRRLHLAAEAGAGRSTVPPLAMLLTAEPGGAPGVETRWHLAPRPGWARDGQPRWRLTRLRARMAPEQGWDVTVRDRRIWLAARDGETRPPTGR